eukprot:3557013-Amphidinium_carterae.1
MLHAHVSLDSMTAATTEQLPSLLSSRIDPASHGSNQGCYHWNIWAALPPAPEAAREESADALPAPSTFPPGEI